MSENKPIKKTSLRLEEDLFFQLKEYSVKQRTPLGKIITTAITEYLKKHDKK